MNMTSYRVTPYRTTLTSSGATVVIATGRLNFPEVDGLRQQLQTIVDGGAVRVAVGARGQRSAPDESGHASGCAPLARRGVPARVVRRVRRR